MSHPETTRNIMKRCIRIGKSMNMENTGIAVAGTCYVDLSIATILSQHHYVTAVDIIYEKVEMINSQSSMTYQPL